MSDRDSENEIESESVAVLSAREQREAVRTRYGKIARVNGDGCCGTGSSAVVSNSTKSTSVASRNRSGCCREESESARAERLGYTATDVAAIEDGANLGLGCGNPGAVADLDRGETVLDLGSGAGFDCFLAAREVGPEGTVIGVDMTPEMVERARENAIRNDRTNVEFRLGEIKRLPVANESADVVISNCVINLSPAKQQVFTEAFRVLRPGGRLAVSDVVLTAPVPSESRGDPESVAGCVAGAATADELEAILVEAGFEDTAIEPKGKSREVIREWSEEHDLAEYVVSATIEGRKPEADSS